ncbi:hypothetical protein CUMW_183480 [Citrus unshiu]|uniref:RRM domain-containing protein n=1 Tax=Citrus unshiu TaxID=55188 RepID=A0A2H5Q012_CITUN|nr:hypothetical protein CUMW_183480 [Citrus unshiu]
MSMPQSSSSSGQFTYAAAPAAPTTANSSYFPLPFHLQQTDPTAVSQYPPPAAYPAPVVPSVYAAPVAPVYSLPQYHQAQQLFQRDAQTITPEALESVKAALASSDIEHKAETKKKSIPRKAAGQTWEDPTLAEWPENFCLKRTEKLYYVVRDKRTGKTKGYGFISFANPSDIAAALKEMNDNESSTRLSKN